MRTHDQASSTTGRPYAAPDLSVPRRLGLVAGCLAVGALLLTGCGPALTAEGPLASSTTSTPSTASAPSTSSASSASAPSTTASPTATGGATSPAPVTAAPAVAVLVPGASGDKVRELQSRLVQLQWYDGTITTSFDDRTRAAVEGFQEKRGLAATGTVDQATWAALVRMTRTPTSDELHNVLTAGPALLRSGSTGAAVKDLQARLRQLAWFSGNVTDTYGPQTVEGVKGFQAKRAIPVTGEVDQRTLDRLHAMTRTPTSDELANVTPTTPASGPVSASGLDSRCLTGRVMCISKANRQLVWLVDGTPLMRLDVRFGSEYHPTREGTFSVFQMNRTWTSTLYGSSMPFSMFFSGGEAVQYSSDFAARGYAGASHGCVNVRDYASLQSLFDQVHLGDKVVVY